MTIQVQPRVVQAGTSVQVAGQIASGAVGEEIAVELKPCGLAWNVLQPVRGTTSSGGVYSVFVESPFANMLLRTRWGQARSETVRLAVRPHLFIRRFRGKLRVEINGEYAPELALRGRYAVIEGRRSGGLWRPIGRVRLRSRTTSYGSLAVGSLRVAPSRYAFVRAALPASQAGPCYAGAVGAAMPG